jgi:hypothetical protein
MQDYKLKLRNLHASHTLGPHPVVFFIYLLWINRAKTKLSVFTNWKKNDVKKKIGEKWKSRCRRWPTKTLTKCLYSSMRTNRATTCTCAHVSSFPLYHCYYHPWPCCSWSFPPVFLRAHTARHVHTLNETFCAWRACMHGCIFIHIHGVWQQGAYLVSILHALKYPSNSVNGVLVHIMKFIHTLYLQTGTHARTHARTHAPRARAHTHTHTHTHEPMLARIMCGMIVSVHLCTHNIRAHSNKNTHEPWSSHPWGVLQLGSFDKDGVHVKQVPSVLSVTSQECAERLRCHTNQSIYMQALPLLHSHLALAPLMDAGYFSFPLSLSLSLSFSRALSLARPLARSPSLLSLTPNMACFIWVLWHA